MDLKNCFSKIVYLGDGDPFVLTFSEIWKMVYNLVNVQILPENIEFFGCLLFFCFQYNND